MLFFRGCLRFPSRRSRVFDLRFLGPRFPDTQSRRTASVSRNEDHTLKRKSVASFCLLTSIAFLMLKVTKRDLRYGNCESG